MRNNPKNRSYSSIFRIFASVLLIYSMLLAPMSAYARTTTGRTAPAQNTTTTDTSPTFALNYLNGIAASITNWFTAQPTIDQSASVEQSTLLEAKGEFVPNPAVKAITPQSSRTSILESINSSNQFGSQDLAIAKSLQPAMLLPPTSIIPTSDGGFETGATLAANSWTAVNGSAPNTFTVGTQPTLYATKSAYITNAGTHSYSITGTSLVHFYRDVTFPAGETKISLSFKWYGQGESTFDFYQVSLAPTTVTPAASTTSTGSLTLSSPLVSGATVLSSGNLQGTVQTVNVSIPASLAGNTVSANTMRLIFTWRSDDSTGTQPPVAFDDISIISDVPGNITSTTTGGNWSAGATWVGGVVPASGDNVTIANGATVTIDTSPNVTDLTVGGGTSGILQYETTNGRTLTVAGNATVAAGGTFRTGATGTVTTHTLAVAGNITNNGTIDFSTNTNTAGAGISFTGGSNSNFTGTGATTDLFLLTMAKSTVSQVVDLNLSNFTVRGLSSSATGALLTSNSGTGTLKFSGTNTFSGTLWSATSYTIPSTMGFWLNNPNFTVQGQAASPTMSGLLRMTAGTYNVGTGTGNSMSGSTTSSFIIEGGTMNFTGRLLITSASASFNMSAGTINITTVGNAGSTSPGFGFTSTSSVFSMSGGTINLVQASTGSTPQDYQVSSTTGTISGGTLNIGTAATATNFNFRIQGQVPNLVIDNTTNNKTATLTAQTNIYRNLTINTGASLNHNATTGFTLLFLGTSVTNNGSIVGTAASSRFDFQGAAAQTYSGTGTFGTNAAPFVGVGVGISNTNNVTLNSPIITTRVNLFAGQFINSNQITIGTGAALGCFVQRGGSAGNPSGSFDVAPNFNLGTGSYQVTYTTSSTAVTTSVEIPATRTLTFLTIDNANGVTLAGGGLSVTGAAGFTLTTGILNTSAANTLTLATTVTTIPSGSATSYVSGPLAIQVNSAANVSRTFAVGTATGWRPVVLANFHSNNTLQTYTAQAIDGNSGGTPNSPLAALNTTRYFQIQNTTNIFSTTTATVQLSYGGDDNVGATATARVAQANTANGAYTSRGGATSASPTTGIVSSTAITQGNNFFVIGNEVALPVTWDGGAGTSNWGDALNWSTDSVPTSASNVTLSFGAATTINVNGTFSVKDLTVGTSTVLNFGTGTLNVTGNYSQTGGTVSINTGNLNVTGTSSLSGGTTNVNSGLFLSTGAFTLNGGIINQGSGTLEIKSALINTSGTFTAGTGTTKYSGAAQTVTSAVSYFNVLLTGGTKTLTAAGAYTLGGDFTVGASATLALSGTSATTLNIGGNLNYGGATGGANISNLTINLTGTNKTINGTSQAFARTDKTPDGDNIETVTVNMLTDASRFKGTKEEGKLENTYKAKAAEVEQLIASKKPNVRLIINLDDVTIVSNPNLEASLTPSAFEMNITVASSASYTLLGNVSMNTGRSLTVSGRLNSDSFSIGGAGAFTLAATGTLGIAGTTAAVTGAGGTILTTGTNTFTANSIVDYNGADQSIAGGAQHPGASSLYVSGTGTKTLQNDTTFTLTTSSTSIAFRVAAGAAFNDGGKALIFTNATSSSGAEVSADIQGSFVSTTGGKLRFEGNAWGGGIRFVNNTTLGDVELAMTTSTNLIGLIASNPPGTSTGTANVSVRNVNLIGAAGGTILLNAGSTTTPLTVTGNVSISPTTVTNTGGGFGGVASTTGTVTVQGNITTTSTTSPQPILNNTGANTLIMGGTSAQTITTGAAATILTGATLQINNSAGVSFGGSNRTYSLGAGGALTLTNGILDAGGTPTANTLALSSTTTVSRTNGYVAGNLRKTYSATGSFTFPVGTANGYSPVTANVTAGTGDLTVKAVQGSQPNLSATNSLQRYWTLAGTGLTTNLTFQYNAGDVSGTEANYKIFRYTSPNFTSFNPATLDTSTHTATLNGVTSLPTDWTLAESLAVFGSLQLSSTTYGVNEGGGSVSVDVTRTGGSNGVVGISYATANGTAAAGSDYTALSNTLSWTSGDSASKTISIPITNDSLYEGLTAEDFTVSINTPTGGATLGIPNSATVSITDNDTAPTISIDSTVTVSENGANAVFTVTQSAVSGTNTTFLYSTADGTATAGQDYTAASNLAGTITAGATTTTISIPIIDDAIYEAPPETFTVTLSNPVNASIATGTGTATITDNDSQPSYSGAYSICDGGTYPTLKSFFDAINAGVVGGNITVNIAGNCMETATATLNQWTESPASSNFTMIIQPSGGAARVVSGAFDDSLIKFNGADRVTIDGLNTGGSSLAVRQSSIPDEGAAKTLHFTNDASGDTVRNTTLEIANNNIAILIDGGASSGNDNLTITGNTISSATGGNASKLIVEEGGNKDNDTQVTNNTLTRFNEAINLRQAGNVTVSGNNLSNPLPSPVVYGISVSLLTGTNTISQNVIHDLTAAQNIVGIQLGDAGNITVDRNRIYSINSEQGASGIGISNSVAGSTMNVVNNFVSLVPPVLTAQYVQGAYYGGNSGGGNTLNFYHNTVLIGGTETGDSDSYGFKRISGGDTHNIKNNIFFNNRVNNGTGTGNHFAIGDGASGSGVFTSDYNVFVGAGAANAADFFDYNSTATPTPVSFATWQAASRDAHSTAVNPGGNYTVANMFVSTTDLHQKQGSGTAAIAGGVNIPSVTADIDGDTRHSTPDIGADEIARYGTLAFDSANYSDSETNADHTVTFTVQRTGGSEGTVTVDYATGAGTATAGSDYTETNGTLTFAPGVTSQIFTVTVKGDTTFETDETVTATLSNPTGGAALGTPNPTTLTITNDDAAPTISIDSVSVSEGGGNAVFTVTQSATSPVNTTFFYSTADGTATAGQDYTGASSGGTITAGNTTTTISIPILQDTIYEGGEDFTVTLSAPANATIATGQGTGTATITDDDTAPTFAVDDVVHNEGNSGTTSYTFTVTKSGNTNLSSSVDFATVDGTATVAGGDYQSNGGTLNFAANETTKNVVVLVNGDALAESNEAFTVHLSNPVGATIADADGTGTITNDDFAPAFTGTLPQTRQKGAAAVNATIANVTDDNGVGTVTVTATTVPAGISVTNIVNTGGAITADVSADCAAAAGANTVVLTASDGANTATANLTVNVTESEIEVSGSGTPISDGDPMPDAADHTDFGTVINGAGFSRTFTISNGGSADLHLTGTPRVSIGGTNAGDFLVTAQPSSTVVSGSPTTFTIKFTPGAAGLRSATVSIDNDDCDENPFNFSIQGNGATAKFRSAASGNWNNVLTWEMSADGTNWVPADHAPTVSDDTILIRNTHTITLTADVTADQLSVAPGGSFVINNSVSLTLNDGAGEDLNVDGSADIKDSGAIAGAGTFRLGAAATLRLGGAIGIENGNTAANIQTTGAKTYLAGDTIIFNGTINQAVGANFPSFVTNLTIDNTGLALNNTVTGNAGQNVTGTLRVQTGTYHGASSYNNVRIDAGAVWTAGAGETVNVTGSWTNDGTFNANGSTVVFNGGAAQIISGAAPSIFDFLTINNASGVSVGGNTQAHQTLTLMNGALSVSASKVLTIDSNVSVTGGSLSSDVNGTVNYVGSASQIVIPAQYGNLGFTGAKTLSPTGTIRISNVFTPSTPTGHTTTGSTVEYNGAGAQTIAQISYDNLSSSGAGGRTIAGTIRIAGAFSPGTNSYTTTGSTVVFNGSAAQTIPSLTGGYNNLSTTNAAGTTLGSDVAAAGAVAIQAGTFDQGAAANLSAGAVSVSAGAAWHNFGTGDVTLGGGVSNAGTISFDANGAGCGTDDILIRSIGGAVQRAWSGTGTFSMSDVDVKNQGGTAIITVNSGTNSGGNGLNWIFVPTCAGGYYTWNGATLADWNVAANWTPTRVTPNASDILIIDGGVTSSPIISNVPTQTVAALRVTNGAQAELRAMSANTTLTVSGATGTDLSVPSGTMLKYGGANALTISVAAGSHADIGGLLLLDGASHRLIGNAAGAIYFLNDALCTTSTTFTGNAFGDGSTGNGFDGSVIFQSGSTYFHNAGGSPFGSASATVATFQTGSTAVWLKNEGFQASGRTYANLVVGSIDPGGVAVNLTAGGAGDFSFDNLTINSTNTQNSSLTFNGSGAGAVNIGGDITGSGIGNGAVVSDVSLTAGTGNINLIKNGTQTFSGGSPRTVTFGSSAQASSLTTLALSRNLIVSAPFALTANSLTGGTNGYVIGNLKMGFAATEAKTFHVGTPNGYSPVDANVTSGTGTLTVKAVQSKLSAIPGNRALNRYWTLEEGASPITADLTFHYLDADFAAPTVETNFQLYKFDGVLSQITSTLDAANNKATTNGISDFSDWTLAEPAAVSTGSVQFAQSTYSVNENGTSLDVLVSRTGGAGGAASVSYATANGSATSGQDFVSTGGNLMWADGDSAPKTINIPITDDTVYEGSEDFTVSLFGATGASIGTPNSTTVTINDNESAPTVTIGDVTQAEGDSGASNFTFTITRTGDTAFGTIVNFHTMNGTAAAGTDYAAIASGSVTFSASETTKTFNVSVNGDAVYETNETFTVELDSASNATITDNSGLGTITNDDVAPALSINDFTFTGADSLVANGFTVTLSGATDLPVTVHYATTDGTAVAGQDYDSANGTLTFNPGDTTIVIPITILADSVQEDTETFTIDLDTPTNATIADGHAVGTIPNDDAAPAFAVSNTSAAEGDSGTTAFTFTVTRTGGTALSSTVSYTTHDGTAAGGATCGGSVDFESKTSSVIFAPADTTKNIVINVCGDTIFELNETFTVELTATTNGTIPSAGATATGTITNDDAPNATLVVNSNNDADDGICDASHCSLREAINAANYSSDVSAINFDIPGTGVRSISPASALPDVTQPVTINGYSQTGASENTLSGGNNAVILIELDGTNAGGSSNGLNLSGDNITVSGLIINRFGTGGAGTVSGINITGSNNVVKGCRIGLDAAGTNSSPNLGSGVSIGGGGSINTVGGSTPQSQNVIANNGGNGVEVRASTSKRNSVRGNSIFNNNNLGIDLNADGVTANDVKDIDTGANDLQNYPVISSATVTGSTRVVSGTLNSTPGQSFAIEFFTNNSCDGSGNGEGQTYLGSLTTGATDSNGNTSYGFNPPALTIGQFITATATNSADGSTSEFSVCAQVTAGTAGDIQFTTATYSVGEGDGTAHITVQRVGGGSGSISAIFNTSDGTAGSGDYTAVSNYSVSYADGEIGTKTVDIPITNDSVYENAETINLSLSSTTVNLVTPAATLTINDNDTAPAFSINDVTIGEGNSGTTTFTFTVTKSGATETASQVGYATADGTTNGAAGGTSCGGGVDYLSTSGTLNFTAAQAQQTITVNVCGDTAFEVNETFFVNLSTPSGASISDNQGLGTILNDDAANTVNVSIPTNLTALTNTVLTVPVTVSSTTGNNSYSFSISYNQSILSPAAVPYNTAGTLSSGSTVTPNTSAPGVLGITANGALSGAGTLIELKFNVVGTPANCSSLTFTSFTFDNANAVVSGPGGMCVRTGNVSGRVTYGTSAMLQAVPGVAINAAGLPNLSTTTDSGGLYNLSGFGTGAYILTPSKSGDVPAGTFSGFDASLAARYAVGIINLDSNQRIAADASGNGLVTSFDASLIAQYAVGITIGQPNQTGTWKFVQPSKSYPNIWTDYASEDFTAVLKGDVSGNWTPSGSFAGSGENNSKLNPVRITMADASVTAGDEIVIPINISDVTNRGVYSFDFEIQFDGNVFDIDEDNITALSGTEEDASSQTDFARILSMPAFIEKTGALSRNYSLAVKRTAKGTLRITGYGIAPLEGAGELLRLKFRAKNGAGAVKSRITWSAAGLNEGGEIPVLAEGAVIGIKKPVE